MNVLTFIWNMRGFGQEGRRRQLINYLRDEDVDIVGLQETIRQDFSISELEILSRQKFSWHWLPATGHSGGILLGAKEDTFEVEDMDRGEFFVSISLTHRRSNLRWEVIIVYGPADHRRSADFLCEIKSKVERCPTPVVVAGDFNLIRSPDDKSSDNVGLPRMRMFNDWIADLALREISRVGARYTWSNNQADPIRSVLDWVLVFVEWEISFPLCSLRALTWIGSDHSPSSYPLEEGLLLGRTGSTLRSSGLVIRALWKQFDLSGYRRSRPLPVHIMRLIFGTTVLKLLANLCVGGARIEVQSCGRIRQISLPSFRRLTWRPIRWALPLMVGFRDTPWRPPLWRSTKARRSSGDSVVARIGFFVAMLIQLTSTPLLMVVVEGALFRACGRMASF